MKNLPSDNIFFYEMNKGHGRTVFHLTTHDVWEVQSTLSIYSNYKRLFLFLPNNYNM